MPVPSSWIWSSFRPPFFAITVMAVDLASMLFSRSSLSADDGRWITSPAAMRLTTVSSSFTIVLMARLARDYESAMSLEVESERREKSKSKMDFQLDFRAI